MAQTISGKESNANEDVALQSKEVTVTKDGTKTKLDVNVDTDIQIGAVEIKNADDDTRAVVKSDGTDNALVVTQNALPLPTDAATETKQDDIKDVLDDIYDTVTAETTAYQEIEESTGNFRYFGKAVLGTGKSDSGWQISREKYDGSIREKTYADGVSTFTKIWDNRASYIYTIPN